MLIQTATRNDCIVMNYSFETYEFNLREYYMPTETYDIAGGILLCSTGLHT